jgi:hypothetical protein
MAIKMSIFIALATRFPAVTTSAPDYSIQTKANNVPTVTKW